MKNKSIYFMFISFIFIAFISINFISFANRNDNLKVNKLEEFVYDANYDTRGLVQSYPKEYGVFYLSDISVPYININSDDAHNVNKEIEGIFNNQLDEYERGISNSFVFIEYSDYEYYIDDNILSVYISYGVSGSIDTTEYHYTYNFNLDTGKLINLVVSDESDELIKNSIKDVVKNMNGSNDDDIYYINSAVKLYLDDRNNNSLKYFYNEDGLNVILKFKVPGNDTIKEFVINI